MDVDMTNESKTLDKMRPAWLLGCLTQHLHHVSACFALRQLVVELP